MTQRGASESLVEEGIMTIEAIRKASLEEVAFALGLKEWGEFPLFELGVWEMLQQRHCTGQSAGGWQWQGMFGHSVVQDCRGK